MVSFLLALSFILWNPWLASGSSPVEQGSLRWLRLRNNPNATGIQPRAGREKLVVSYTIPIDDKLSFLRGRSWVYDNAIAAIALLLHGSPRRPRRILSNLKNLMGLDGSIGFSYQINSDFIDSNVRAGTLAWVGYAMLLYQQRTGSRRFLDSAIRIGGYLRQLQTPSGSLRGGPDVQWVSTEHNLDSFFFFQQLYRATSNETYRDVAHRIKKSLLANHWTNGDPAAIGDPAGPGGAMPHFLRGIGDDTPALDANALGALFLIATGRPNLAMEALAYVESTFRTHQTIAGSNRTIFGYAPDARRATIWLEGTLMTALAYRRLGNLNKATQILNQIHLLQEAWIAQGRWRGDLPYAMPRTVDPDGDTFAEWESVAATGWLLITLAEQVNPTPLSRPTHLA